MFHIMQWFPGISAILIACVVLALVCIIFVIVGFVKKKPVKFRIITIALAVCFTLGSVISWIWLERCGNARMIEMVTKIQGSTWDDYLPEPYDPVDE